MVEWIPKMLSGSRRATSAEMTRLSRPQQVVFDLSLPIIRNGMVSTGTKRIDTIEIRLALRCLLPHCPERWPLELYWDAAGQENEIGHAQGCTAAFNGTAAIRGIPIGPIFEMGPGDSGAQGPSIEPVRTHLLQAPKSRFIFLQMGLGEIRSV